MKEDMAHKAVICTAGFFGVWGVGHKGRARGAQNEKKRSACEWAESTTLSFKLLLFHRTVCALARPEATRAVACSSGRQLRGRQPRLEALCERALLRKQLLRLPDRAQLQ